MSKKDHNLIWIDLEMTGLDPDIHRIIEIATIVTDGELNVLEEGPVLAIHQPEEVMAGMNKWCVKQHNASGLVKRVQDSEVSEREAEKATLKFLAKHAKKGASPMCGNSVHQDRRFLRKYMPELEAFFHYRLLDVSTLKELAKRWSPKVYDAFDKEGSHLALDDIKESIDELKHYRKYFINEKSSEGL